MNAERKHTLRTRGAEEQQQPHLAGAAPEPQYIGQT